MKALTARVKLSRSDFNSTIAAMLTAISAAASHAYPDMRKLSPHSMTAARISRLCQSVSNISSTNAPDSTHGNDEIVLCFVVFKGMLTRGDRYAHYHERQHYRHADIYKGLHKIRHDRKA